MQAILKLPEMPKDCANCSIPSNIGDGIVFCGILDECFDSHKNNDKAFKKCPLQDGDALVARIAELEQLLQAIHDDIGQLSLERIKDDKACEVLLDVTRTIGQLLKKE